MSARNHRHARFTRSPAVQEFHEIVGGTPRVEWSNRQLEVSLPRQSYCWGCRSVVDPDPIFPFRVQFDVGAWSHSRVTAAMLAINAAVAAYHSPRCLGVPDVRLTLIELWERPTLGPDDCIRLDAMFADWCGDIEPDDYRRPIYSTMRRNSSAATRQIERQCRKGVRRHTRRGTLMLKVAIP